MRLVTVTVLGIASTTAKDALDSILTIGVRTDIHERVVQIRHFTIFIHLQGIVIIAVVTTEDGVNTSLQILHVGCRLQQTGLSVRGGTMKRSAVGSIIADAVNKIVVIFIFTMNNSSEVVSAIHNIPNPGEGILVAATAIGLPAYIHLGMA